MQVAKAYGMIQPGTSDTPAVRATFIIDPQAVLRALVYYPMSNGRSIDQGGVIRGLFLGLATVPMRRPWGRALTRLNAG